ncbi:MAG: helix-turn-helix transcriptional regulator [Candidatus Riflebacteria bacterium]|nr:helix-turn-helix transcriptional regulator [Candidatus Riflebacteria bacterium]
MIRNEAEYQAAVQRLTEEETRIRDHEAHLSSLGLGADDLARAMAPIRSFHLQLQEEVSSYESLRRGELEELLNLYGLGRTLVGLRIALGITQRDLAERLAVHESQVSRDERNEYHGISVDRASRILDALGVHLRSTFEHPLQPHTGQPKAGL